MDPHTPNTQVYEELGSRWYTAQDDPIALLRAESRLRNPWIAGLVASRFDAPGILDLGCGAGFLANELSARHPHWTLHGIDQSESALAVARSYDTSKRVTYHQADALHLPFEAGRFDVVCAMDFLEHVSNPGAVIAEASRVLKPGGLFFFATFNRNWLSHLIVIKGVERFVKNVPPDLHVIDYFIKPTELSGHCATAGLQVQVLRGTGPKVWSRPFLNLVRSGVVDQKFEFEFSRNTLMGYTGYALKRASS